MKSRRTKATDFNTKEKAKMIERDNNMCIFCQMGYDTEGAGYYERNIRDYMHFIPRSKGGLGIAENGALGCRFHHRKLDFGTKDIRARMQEDFREYLKKQYIDWNEEKLMYNRWEGITENE